MKRVTFKFDVACLNELGAQYIVYCRDTLEVEVISDIWHYKMGGFPGLRKWHGDRPTFLQKYPSFTSARATPDYVCSIVDLVKVVFKKHGNVVARVYMRNCCYAKAFRSLWLEMDGANTCVVVDYWAKRHGYKFRCNHVPKLMTEEALAKIKPTPGTDMSIWKDSKKFVGKK